MIYIDREKSVPTIAQACIQNHGLFSKNNLGGGGYGVCKGSFRSEKGCKMSPRRSWWYLVDVGQAAAPGVTGDATS